MAVVGVEEPDVTLLVHQYLHSNRMSQKPVLLQPREVAMQLRWEDLKPSRRNALGERLLKECWRGVKTDGPLVLFYTGDVKRD